MKRGDRVRAVSDEYPGVPVGSEGTITGYWFPEDEAPPPEPDLTAPYPFFVAFDGIKPPPGEPAHLCAEDELEPVPGAVET